MLNGFEWWVMKYHSNQVKAVLWQHSRVTADMANRTVATSPVEVRKKWRFLPVKHLPAMLRVTLDVTSAQDSENIYNNLGKLE